MKRTKGIKRANAISKTAAPASAAHIVSADDRAAAGKALRDNLPREQHGKWKEFKGRPSPIDLLHKSDAGRMKELVPIRYGRMLQSPFAFYRGSAGVMASDLSRTPNTGLNVQACGDCHLMNFGGFATPERNIIFDINDFDETSPAPWEWDVKRLAASIVLAARSIGLSDSKGRDCAVAAARSYREHMREFSRMDPLRVWYTTISRRRYHRNGAQGLAEGRQEADRKSGGGQWFGTGFSQARGGRRRTDPHHRPTAIDLSSGRDPGPRGQGDPRHRFFAPTGKRCPTTGACCSIGIGSWM